MMGCSSYVICICICARRGLCVPPSVPSTRAAPTTPPPPTITAHMMRTDMMHPPPPSVHGAGKIETERPSDWLIMIMARGVLKME